MIKNIDIILSTRNPSKAEQIKAVFIGSSFNILTLDEVGIQGEAIEDSFTLKENSLKKALFARRPGQWSMADDTGIFITVLNGAPGIRAARWAGETATTEEITLHTLKSLEDKTDRSAFFETVVALISPEGKEYFFNGKVVGRILKSPKLPPQPKMPYSAIFAPEGMDKVWAEMTIEEENNISHRGQAFKQAREFLENY
ncbi:non-canonical purine NTP pyrophosphatase [Candidatus Azambacteria bacterium]|nr:non-canonical purine NTP pyrophosphatase [Candidatus Azambacteria bacterium]